MARDYGKVYPRFWTAGTGKELRGDIESQLLALYLITCPHANMIGVFHCPIMYMAHETGLTEEGASKALRRLQEGGFCTFDALDDVIWVHEMAAHQIGPLASPKDKQVIGLRKQVEQIAQPAIREAFTERYHADFHLIFSPKTASPIEAPCKPLRSQEQEQEQEQEKKKKTNGHFSPIVYLRTKGVEEQAATDWITLRRAKKLPATLTAINGIEDEAGKAHLTLAQAVTECCHRGWAGFKASWLENADGGKATNGRDTAPPWWSSEASIQAKGRELGLTARGGESWQDFKGRIQQRIQEQHA